MHAPPRPRFRGRGAPTLPFSLYHRYKYKCAAAPALSTIAPVESFNGIGRPARHFAGLLLTVLHLGKKSALTRCVGRMFVLQSGGEESRLLQMRAAFCMSEHLDPYVRPLACSLVSRSLSLRESNTSAYPWYPYFSCFPSKGPMRVVLIPELYIVGASLV